MELIYSAYESVTIGDIFSKHFEVETNKCLTDDLLEIISRDAPQSVSPEAYRGYANLLLSVFHVVCRSLSELRHLVSVCLSFTKFRLNVFAMKQLIQFAIDQL